MAKLIEFTIDGTSNVRDININGSSINVYASKFIKTGSSDEYVLLGGGGHKLLSDIDTPLVNAISQVLGVANSNSIRIDDIDEIISDLYGGKIEEGKVYAQGFVKSGSSSSYMLLGDGGHKAISDFSASSHTHYYIGDGGIELHARYNNEVNFGGTSNSSTIYFGYRAVGSKPIPANIIFGGTTGTSAVTASKYTSTVTTGTQPYACTSTTLNTNLNADLLDGIHAAGLFTALANSGNNISVTIGGTNKTLTVAYATSAGSVARATFGDSSNGEHNANNIKSNGLWYYTSNGPSTTLGASTNDGAIYSQAYSTSWVGQIAQDYRNGNLFTRGLNNGTWRSWKRIVYEDEVNALAGGISVVRGMADSNLEHIMTLESIISDLYGGQIELGIIHGSITGNADTVDSQHFSYSNTSNSPTYLWATNSTGTSFLARRDSISVNYASSAGAVAWANVSGKPIATTSSLGLVKSSTTGTTANRTYNVEVNSDGTMKVNVPWTDNNTTYSAGTGITISGTTISNSGVLVDSITDLNTPTWSDYKLTFSRFNTSATNAPPVTNNANGVMNFPFTTHGTTGMCGYQVAFSSNNNIYARFWSAGTPTSWKTIVTSSNISSYAITSLSGYATESWTTTTLGNYVSKTGNSVVSGAITFAGNNAYGIRTQTDNYGRIGESDKRFYELYVNRAFTDSITCTGSISATDGFYETSDKRLKHVITNNLDFSLDDLRNIPKIKFMWNNSKCDRINIGTIAQEVQKYFPELVSEDETTGYLSVAYDKLAVVALAAIDKLTDEITTLKHKIEKLEK